jgi:hypothetical protein
MSADTPARPPGDANRGGADQVKPATPPADAHRQRGDARPRQPPGTQTRQDHADAMLASPPGHAREAPARGTPAGGRDSRQESQAQPERSTAPKPEAGQHPGHRPEARLRQDHADAMLASPPGRSRDGEAGETTSAAGKRASPRDSQNGQPASAAADSQPHGNGRRDYHGAAAARPGETALPSRGQGAEGHARGGSPRKAAARDGPRDDAADRPGQGAGDSPAQPHVTHYQASFRGEQLDLWTDGQGNWASGYQRADDALPVDHVADVRSRMGPEAMPATEWADGHEIAVTRDPRDGVWIPGLPGEAPDEAGDVLAGSDAPEEKRSRSRDLVSEVLCESEDIFDATDQYTTLGYNLLPHPPEGKAEVPVPAHGPALESTPHETEIGGMMSGVLAATIGLWILGQKVHDWHTREKTGAGHASDG